MFKCERWTLANLLPVFFVLWVIGSIWGLYVTLHLMHLLEIWRPEQPGIELVHDEKSYQRGVVQAVISQLLAFMMMVCFTLAVFTDPGSVPETPEWMPDLVVRPGADPEGDDINPPEQHEVKLTGAPRYCKWCNCYKPDRCHHCRVCRSCVLRMDHHCPWIANCVGFRNHKHFLLLVFYSLLACVFISTTMSETLHRALTEETTFVRRFLVVFGMTLSVMMGVLLTLFFGLHVWLMHKATTTIEFCEKAYKRNGKDSGTVSIFQCGFIHNIQSVLGTNPLLWLLPCFPPEGDGLHFKVNRTQDSLKAPLQPGSGSDRGTEGEQESEIRKTSTTDISATPEVTGQHASNS